MRGLKRLLESAYTEKTLRELEGQIFAEERLGPFEGFWARVYDRVIAEAKRTGDAEVVREYERRKKLTPEIQAQAERILGDVVSKARGHYGETKAYVPVAVGLSFFRLEPAHVGAYEPAKGDFKFSVLSVHPGAIHRPAYFRVVLKHELVHHIVDQHERAPEHGQGFRALARGMKIPKKFQD